jgi:hypothetical protein
LADVVRISNLFGNRVTEKDLRDHLESLGYRGSSAHFESLELLAIERPGWIQVFTFDVQTSDIDGQRHRFFGVMRDDERIGFQVHLARDVEEQQSIAEVWSTGLIRCRRRRLGRIEKILIGVFALAMALALLGASLS